MTPRLSKSRFQYGLQCLKRLYLETYSRELADPVAPALQAIFDTGTSVGEMARLRFPNGRLVEETYQQHGQAVETTRSFLEAGDVSAIFEAGFTFEGIRTRVDVLRKSGPGTCNLIEVKSTTRVKPEHITDVAIQLYVAEGSGVPIDRAFLMHLNRDYVYEGGDHDMRALFSAQDVTRAARTFAEERIPGELARMWAALQEQAEPDIATGPHCESPYRCSFYDYCHDAVEQDSGQPFEPFVSDELFDALGEIRLPAAFLDFETTNPAIPRYAGTRPYQAIPFQWSMRVLGRDGSLGHRWYLHDDGGDPREGVAASLLEAVPSHGSIVAYSNYERTVLSGLARDLPGYSARLKDMSDRVVDLHRLVRSNFRHPDLAGSYSLKSVLPVLVPGMDYDDLDIADGMTAAASYALLVDEVTAESDRAAIRESLLAYCGMDTEAMVRIYEALVEKSAHPG